MTILPVSVFHQGAYPFTAINTAVWSQLIRPALSCLLNGMEMRYTSLTGLFLIEESFTSGKPVVIVKPISTPLNKIDVGQLLKTSLEAAESILTLNSLPAGKAPAIQTNRFTFLATSSFPLSFEYLSAGDISSSARLVRKPTVMIVTDLSGCDANDLL